MDFDLIIVGGGPAGLTAGIYAARGGLKTLILESGITGGQITQTADIENYPGYPSGDGFSLTDIFRKQAENFGCEIKNEEVTKIEKGKITTTEQAYNCQGIILAMGAKAAKLNVPGEEKFTGRGVSYCATCDGMFYKGKVVAVVGGGDAAVEEALFLTKFATKVYIIHRRNQLRATKIIGERAKKNEKIEFVWDSIVEKIDGDDKVSTINLKNVKTGKKSDLNTDGVFIYAGTQPQTALIKDFITLDERGFIVTDKDQKTNVPLIYAAGDICQKSLRQVVTAAADGAIAAFNLEKDLSEQNL